MGGIMLNKKLVLALLLTCSVVNQAQTSMGLYEKGIDQHQHGQNQDAVGSLREAVRRDPNFAAGFNSLCVVYDELNLYPEAIEACRHALALNPQADHTLYNL